MIDERAVIDASAKLGRNVSIGPFSVVGADVFIDDGTWIGPHVVINGPSRIGKQNKIYQFASLGEIPQDKKYGGEATELVIGNGNSIREYCTINRGTAQGGGVTRVGDDNWIMAYVHIAHDCIIGTDVIFSNGVTLAGHVQIDDHAVLGGFTLVHQFCRIGAYSFCGMGTALNRDLAPYVAASGNYAKTYGINKEGLRRHGFSADTIRALHKAYMTLIKAKSARDEARQTVLDMGKEYPEVRRLVEFIDGSERGIVR
ncbi:MAG: acyl-ACP--UDP-N-acetylglucosamine O-acyltransferase [Gammaproteobacteria bacterium]